MKLTLIYLFAILCNTISYGYVETKTDSLLRIKYLEIRKEIEKNPSTAKISISKFQSSSNKKLNIALSELLWGQYYFQKDITISKNHFVKADVIFRKLNDKKGQANSKVALASISYMEGYLDEAVSQYQAALKNMNPKTDAYNIANINNNIASVFLQLENYRKSIFYYKKALNGYLKEKDTNGIALVYQKLGSNYFNLREYEISWEFLEKSEKIAVNGKQIQILSVVYQKQGDLYYERDKDFEKALNCYKKSEQIITSMGDVCSLLFLLDAKGDCLFKLGKFNESELAFKKAISYIKQCDAAYKESEIYRHLFETLYKQSKYDEALQCLMHADSIDKRTNLQEIRLKTDELETKYQTAEKDKKLAQNKLSMLKKNKELERKNRIVWSVGMLLVLVGLVSWFAFRTARKQKQLNHQLAEINRFDDMLYRIIGHDLKSMIASNAYDLPLETRQQTTQQTINVLEGLLEWRKQDNHQNTVNLARLLDQIEDENELLLKHKDISIEVSTDSWPSISCSEKAMETILRNLLSNAITYGLEKTSISIQVSATQLVISNDFESKTQHGTQIGHTIVQALCDKYAIGFKFEKNKGKASAILTF